VKKKVLIGDNHASVRSGIRFVIKDVAPSAIVHEARNGNELISSIRETEYDLIIVDIDMSGSDPLALIDHLLAGKEVTKVLVLSTHAAGPISRKKTPKMKNPFEKLSAKERLIARYYLLGYTNTEIKKILHLHASTIGTLKIRLFGKLKIKSLVALVELARLYQPDLYDLQK
jgi:DNA-binding NarL/FixJ family response regulator